MDEQHWQKLMKRIDLADKIADSMLYDDDEEEEKVRDADVQELCEKLDIVNAEVAKFNEGFGVSRQE